MAAESFRTLLLELDDCKFSHGSFFDEHPELRDEYNWALEALHKKMYVYPDLSDTLQSNRSIALEAMKCLPDRFCDLNAEFWDDEEIVMTAWEHQTDNDVRWFGYISERLRNEKHIVKRFLAKDGNLLRSVHERFQRDPECIRVALKSTPGCIKYMSDEIKNDKRLVQFAFDSNVDKHDKEKIYHYISKPLRLDKDLLIHAIRCHSVHPETITKKFLKDYDIIRELLIEDNNHWRYIPGSIKIKFKNQYHFAEEYDINQNMACIKG